ncbi:hypothetical protein DYB32_002067 [Aphanomyces invadans]|uniref:Uncharacterized protein n=1 Tax=Aphanomyces invadans TaxID=157072 RepID=A0A3R6ZUD3_9STRA|nr:hypothetical protein DYB32_002067 [Aphanomyces invadans]
MPAPHANAVQAVILGAAVTWIYCISEFRIVMWLRYLALCFGLAGWCLLPGGRHSTAESLATNEPEHEEDTPLVPTATSNAADGKPDPLEENEVAQEDATADVDATTTDPEFVCQAPTLLRLRSRDVYLTTQEEKWAQDEHGHMYLSQSSKRVLIQCPASENEAVLQRVAQCGFTGAAMVPSPSTGPPSPRQLSLREQWTAYIVDQAKAMVHAVVDSALRVVGGAILMATCGLVWNYSLGINTDISFHDLLWKHLQDV